MRLRDIRRVLLLTMVASVLAASLHAQQQISQEAVPTAPPITLASPGAAMVELGGPWQFHSGDDPRWAEPGYGDSHWPAITTDKGWDVQGYPGHGGFAWYRRHLHFTVPAERDVPLALLYPTDGNNVYEAFWNGRSLGACGEFPPHDRVVSCRTPARLPDGAGTGDAVLAIRVWAIPMYNLAPPGEQGFDQSPRLGSLQAARAFLDQQLYHSWRNERVTDALTIVDGVAALLAFFTFLLNRREPLYCWLTLFLLISAANTCIAWGARDGVLSWELEEVLILFVPYTILFIILWLLLLRLFRLDSERFWTRATKAMIALSILATIPLAWLCLTISQWNEATAQLFRIAWVLLTVTELYSFVLITAGMRRKQDRSRWTVAIAATLAFLWPVIYNIFQLLQRWEMADRVMSRLSFHFAGGLVGIPQVSQLLLLIALCYTAARILREARRERTEVELELRSAHEVQQILIPEDLPDIPGFALTSAYRPAREVGGDFYQVIPLDDCSTLLLIGDVSGKGLRAAMMVALITGAVRTAVESNPDPAALLTSLNRRLNGRMQGGFVTSLALRLFPDGECTMVNAGHLPPVMNGKEFDVAGALPLGLHLAEVYESVSLHLLEGDTLTLYTDGIPEARNAGGELFGFERTAAVIAELRSAEKIAQRAQEFGQDDDITVLTIERLSPMHHPVGPHVAACNPSEQHSLQH